LLIRAGKLVGMGNTHLIRRHGVLVALVIATFVFASGRALAQAPPAQAPPAMVMKQHTFNDPGMGNMPSHTILAPKDWTATGSAWWPPQNLFRILPSQDIRITAADGRFVRIGPSMAAVAFQPSPMAGVPRPQEGTVDGGNLVLYMPPDANAWRQWIAAKVIPQEYPNARNIRVETLTVLPELTTLMQRQLAPLRQQQEQMNQQNQQMGLGMRSFMDGVVYSAICSYELDGRKYDQQFIFGVVWLGTDSQFGRQLWWGIEPNVAFRAPAGQLEANMPLFMTVANSLRMTPQWQKMKLDHMQKMAQIDAKGAADRSRIIAESHREISKMITEGYNQRQASQDRAHDNFIKAIREVDDFTVPGSNTSVQLPHYYEHVYTNTQGDYILTNDSLYNPNTDPAVNNQNWQTMERVP
jgi:hypothetical protein